MSATVEVFTGIAGTGKTKRLFDEYRRSLVQAIAEHEPATTLWLTPTHRARRMLLGTLLDQSMPACLAPNIYTFEAFAEEVLKWSGEGIRPLGQTVQRVLLRQIIDDLEQQRKLPHFSPIAQTSGFLDLLIAFIAELKRDETWPSQFLAACDKRGATHKDRELALIYDQYQQRLLDLSLYDAEGRFWSARTALQNGAHGPAGQLSLVVADGFTDFTPTQYEILSLLTRSCDRLLISLPLESSSGREDLFAKTTNAHERLESMLSPGVRLFQLDPRPVRSEQKSTLNHIAKNLFRNTRGLARLETAAGIEILAAVGQVGEVQALAERVKGRLLYGVPANDIVVGFRSLNEYSDLVREIFAAAGIPFCCDFGIPLSRAGSLNAMVSVLNLELEDWSFGRLRALLDSNYFRPDWHEWQSGQAARTVAAQLRRLKLDGQRLAILHGLQRQADKEAERSEPEKETAAERCKVLPPAALTAFEFLSRLSDALMPLRERADLAKWVEVLVSLGRELGIAPNAAGDESSIETPVSGEVEMLEQEVRVWDTFERSLFEAANVERLASSEPRLFSLTEVIPLLIDLLHSQRSHLPTEEHGRVRVLEVTQLRNL